MKQEAIIIDGKKISSALLSDLKIKINQLKDQKICLAIILIGGDAASSIYVRNKMRTAEKIGIFTQLHE